MEYFEARVIDIPPFLVFDKVARNEDELCHRQLCKGKTVNKEFVPKQPIELNKGVFSKEQLPSYQYGICLSKLNAKGELVSISKNDLAKAKSEFENEECLREEASVDSITAQNISNERFTFKRKSFSASIPAQLNWNRLAFLHQTNKFGSAKPISTKDGQVYNLKYDDLPDFMEALDRHIESKLAEGRKAKGTSQKKKSK